MCVRMCVGLSARAQWPLLGTASAICVFVGVLVVRLALGPRPFADRSNERRVVFRIASDAHCWRSSVGRGQAGDGEKIERPHVGHAFTSLHFTSLHFMTSCLIN